MTTIDIAEFIADNDTFTELCEQWLEKSYITLDTEFIRTDTFFPIAGLLQVSDGDTNYLIDPLKISDFNAFATLLECQSVVKVLHSCSEDLEVFDRLTGTIPSPLFDTQIAAAACGLGFSLSYQRLIEELLSTHVEKGETRSNWLQRPLTTSQCHYAALDVEYLPQAYELLIAKLNEHNRLHWVQEESQAMLDKFQASEPYYKKVKSAWKLSPAQLSLLDQLTTWREEQARSRNVPRGRILKDRSCYEIAAKPPRNLRDLSLVEDMNSKIVRNDGDTILELVSKSKQQGSALSPLPKPLPKESGAGLKRLKDVARKRAESLAVPVELLVKKRDYEALIRSGLGGNTHVLPSSLQGWRKSVIGDELLALLNT